MVQQLFNIVFDGKIVEGGKKSEVKKNLSSFFKIDPQSMNTLFSGQIINIQKGVDHETALKYQKAFNKAGAICNIKQVAADINMAKQSKNDMNTSAEQKKEYIICPCCGFEQVESVDCPKCGIVIKKYATKNIQRTRTKNADTTEKSSNFSKNTLLVFAFVIVFAAILIFNRAKNSTVKLGPGVTAPNKPVQTATEIDSFTVEGFTITPLADYHIDARVLGVKAYCSGREAALSPVDLALGWRRMSDDTVLEKINIRQSNRFYFWKVKEFPIPQKEIEENSANTHLIPANESIAKQMKSIRKGHLVNIAGYLVQVKAVDGWHWKSSLTRNDTGKGACELLWVEELEIVENFIEEIEPGEDDSES